MTDFAGDARSAFLFELREKRSQLDQLIAQIESLGPTSPDGGDGGPSVGRHDFVGMSTPEAIKKFLRKKKGLHEPRAIARALMDGGYDADSEDSAYVNVYSALKRMRAAAEVVKRQKEWGLAEHYPNLAKKQARAGDADDDDKETETDATPAKGTPAAKATPTKGGETAA